MNYDVNNPTTKGRYCPTMRKNCPGTHDGCAFWRTETVKPRGSMQDVLIQNCLFVLQYEATYQGVAEQIRTQNTVQHFNNQVHISVLAMQRGVEVPALSGNFDKDKKLIAQFVAGGYKRALAEHLEQGEDGGSSKQQE